MSSPPLMAISAIDITRVTGSTCTTSRALAQTSGAPQTALEYLQCLQAPYILVWQASASLRGAEGTWATRLKMMLMEAMTILYTQ